MACRAFPPSSFSEDVPFPWDLLCSPGCSLPALLFLMGWGWGLLLFPDLIQWVTEKTCGVSALQRG